MKNMIKLSLTLAAYAVVACVGLAFVYQATAPLIEAAADRERNAALAELFPGVSQFEEVGSELSTGNASIVIQKAWVAKKETEAVGMIVQVTGPTYATSTVLVAVDMNRSLVSTKFLEVTDTPGLGTKVAEEPFAGQFNGKKIDDGFVLGSDLVAISGATISSKGVANMIKLASYTAGDYLAANHGAQAGSGGAPVIVEEKPVDIDTGLTELFPGAEFTEITGEISNTYERSVLINGAWLVKVDGKVAGVALRTAGQTYKASTILTGVNMDRTLAGIRVIESSDTPKIGLAAMVSAGFYELFSGKSADDGFLVNAPDLGAQGEMDAVTGATISMMGVANMAKVAAAAGSDYLAQSHGGAKGGDRGTFTVNVIPEQE